jgi:hypothetical protein
MERGRKLSSKVLFLVLAVIGSGMPAQAQLSDATRSLYQARLADNAAGRYTGFSGSPLVGVTPIPALEAVVSWDRLRRDSYTGSFPEYALFLRSYPDWPQSLIIRRQAEKLIDDSVSARDRIAFFDKFPPLSAQAKLRLAEALQTVGRVPEAVATARDAVGRQVRIEPDAGRLSLARRQVVVVRADHGRRALAAETGCGPSLVGAGTNIIAAQFQ